MADDPVVQTIYIDPKGKSLSARMLAAYGSPGHYSLMLLESDRSTIVVDWGKRKFTTPQENTHDLPGSAADNIGRYLYALTSVGVVDPSGAYAVIMTVLQNKEKVGSASDSGTTADDTKESTLIAHLEKKPAEVMVFEITAAGDPDARLKDLKAATVKARDAGRKRVTRTAKRGKKRKPR
ncbi:MAG: hypothetical protein ABI556_03705 [Gemmatimonadales bacterium]